VSLERCFAAVEEVASLADDGPDLVAYSFLNELPPGTRAAVSSYLGPVAVQLVECLHSGDGFDRFNAGSHAPSGPNGP